MQMDLFNGHNLQGTPQIYSWSPYFSWNPIGSLNLDVIIQERVARGHHVPIMSFLKSTEWIGLRESLQENRKTLLEINSFSSFYHHFPCSNSHFRGYTGIPHFQTHPDRMEMDME